MGPRYLILDEPTAGLDPAGRRELLQLLARLHREQGVAVVLITHQLEDVARLAQRVVVLARGRVALTGPPSAVLGAGRRSVLQSLGLDVPVAARLVDELKRRGWALPDDAVLEEEVAAAIVAAVGRGRGQGPGANPPGGGSTGGSTGGEGASPVSGGASNSA